MTRRKIDSATGYDAVRLWKEEKEQLKHGQRWLRVKALSLDQFRLIKQLGMGFYGQVQLVKHKCTGNLYAMKAYHHTGGHQDQLVIESLNQERILLMQVNSVWVERMFHSVQDSHFHFIILEYIPGGTLADLLSQEGNLQDNQARFYGAEMLMAINVLHRCGFMHRNLQPNNFHLDQFGHVKIVDFGTSFRFLPEETCTRMAVETSFKDGKPFLSAERRERVQIYQRKTASSNVGPLEFMAPEVVRKRSKGLMTYLRPADPATMYSFAADFWSFGVCMYYFLFGQLPFTGKNKAKLTNKIVNWRKTLTFPVVQPISHEAKDLIKRLLCDEPYRLGFYGCEDVMSHAFFDSIDWLHLRDWPVPVPFQSDSELSDTSSDPPAFIAELLRSGNRASNNDKLPGSNEYYLRDDLQGTVDQIPSGSSSKCPEQKPTQGSSMASTSTPSMGVLTAPNAEDSQDLQISVDLVRHWSPSRTRLGSQIGSEGSVNVSWDDQSGKSFNRQDIQQWLQTSHVSARLSPVKESSMDAGPAVSIHVDPAQNDESNKELYHLSKSKQRQEKSKIDGASCLIL